MLEFLDVSCFVIKIFYIDYDIERRGFCMNTVQLECFVAVAEYLNFSKASAILKITQPAVSHQIQSLEKELDVKLFNRTSKNVTLTPDGLLFLADAQLILKTAMSAKERLGNHEHFHPLELGCHNQIELRLLPPILKTLAKEFPLLRPNIHLIPFPSLVNMIENNQIHAALGLKESHKNTSLYYRELCKAPAACVCAPDHPLSQFPSLTTDLLTGNFIACTPRPIPDSFFSIQNDLLAKLPPENHFLTDNVDSAFALIKAELGFSIYPDIPAARDRDLCYIPVTNLPKISFGVYCRYKHDTPLLKRFLFLAEKHLLTAENLQKSDC